MKNTNNNHNDLNNNHDRKNRFFIWCIVYILILSVFCGFVLGGKTEAIFEDEKTVLPTRTLSVELPESENVVPNVTLRAVLVDSETNFYTLYNYFSESVQCKYRFEPLRQQEIAHEVAEYARKIGLEVAEEDSIIIKMAQNKWWEAQKQIEADLETLATAIYVEAGSGCCEEHMMLIAQVIMNRVYGNYFPNTVTEVVEQKGQYPSGYSYSMGHWRIEAKQSGKWDYYYSLAQKVLYDTFPCPENVIFQSAFKQGKGIYREFWTMYGVTYICWSDIY